MKYFFSVIIILLFTDCKETDNENISNTDFVISKYNERYDRFVEAIINNDTAFSSKYDTIKGGIIPNLFSFMEQNGMKYYFIRRFNDAEINANFK